jgi:hypothetical protein
MADRLNFETDAKLETGLITGHAGVVKLRIDARLGDGPDACAAMSWSRGQRLLHRACWPGSRAASGGGRNRASHGLESIDLAILASRSERIMGALMGICLGVVHSPP